MKGVYWRRSEGLTEHRAPRVNCIANVFPSLDLAGPAAAPAVHSATSTGRAPRGGSRPHAGHRPACQRG
jgi:hypothetical protein